jgi:hypothetical protein
MLDSYDSPDSVQTPSILATRASIDREKQTDQVVDSSSPQYKRPIPTWQWISVCTGLYLGGLLYGEHCSLLIVGFEA